MMKKSVFSKLLVMLGIIIAVIGISVTQVQAAASVKLNVQKKNLKVGKTFQLKLKKANGNVIWESSNTKVATVDETGLVTAQKKGKATITAVYDGKEYTCIITVKKASKNSGNNGNKNGNKKGNKADEAEAWLMEAATECISGLKKLSSDEGYLECYLGSPEYLYIIENWNACEPDFTADKYVFTSTDDIVKKVLAYSGESYSMDSFSEQVLADRVPCSIINLINSRQGAIILAASSVAFYEKSYSTSYDIDNMVWFIPSDKAGLAYAVAIYHSGDGVVTLQADYLIYDETVGLNEFLDEMLAVMK